MGVDPWFGSVVVCSGCARRDWIHCLLPDVKGCDLVVEALGGPTEGLRVPAVGPQVCYPYSLRVCLKQLATPSVRTLSMSKCCC